MRTQLLVLLVAIAWAGRLTAQDHPAQVVMASTIIYPEILRVAGIAGLVEATVVVLPGDTVATDGVQVVRSAHPGFRNAVKVGLGHWTYRAAVRGGVAVPDTVRVALMFDPGSGGALTFGPTEVRELRPGGAGVWHGVVSRNILRGRGSELKGIQRDSAGIAAVRYFAQHLGPTPGGGARIVCVTMHAERGVEPLTAVELDALQVPGVAVVDPRRCPPTFNSMAYVVGRVIPPGSDPGHVVVLGAREYEEGWIVIRIETPFGNGKNSYDCMLRSAPIGEVSECAVKEQEVY